MEITLEYWNSLANQFVVICSLLSGFSITIVTNLIVSEKNDRLTNNILKAATISSGCFLVALFAMTRISMMTISSSYLQNVVANDFLVPRIIGILAFFLGLLALSILLMLSGWTKSRKAGIFSTVIGVITLLLILTTMIEVRF